MRGERERIFLPLNHSPDVCDSYGWARCEPGAGNPMQLSRKGDKDPNACALPAACQGGISRSLELELESSTPIWHPSVPGGILADVLSTFPVVLFCF